MGIFFFISRPNESGDEANATRPLTQTEGRWREPRGYHSVSETNHDLFQSALCFVVMAMSPMRSVEIDGLTPKGGDESGCKNGTQYVTGFIMEMMICIC